MEELVINQDSFEYKLLLLYRRLGTTGLVCFFSVIAVILTVLTLPFIYIFNLDGGHMRQYPMTVLLNYIGVSGLVAPIVSYIGARMVRELDLAYEKVSRLSRIDSLTGTYNRRGFFTTATRYIRTSTEAEVCLVGMVDLDNFKQINDLYGHQIGDRALNETVRRLTHCITHQGVTGRLGGDEFAFVISGKKSDMQKLQVRLLQHCGSFSLPTGVAVTCSIGMVNMLDAENFDDVLARADKDLYNSKRVRENTDRALSVVG